jgi:hypothetical protein
VVVFGANLYGVDANFDANDIARLKNMSSFIETKIQIFLGHLDTFANSLMAVTKDTVVIFCVQDRVMTKSVFFRYPNDAMNAVATEFLQRKYRTVLIWNSGRTLVEKFVQNKYEQEYF